jgi:hypothetical protein
MKPRSPNTLELVNDMSRDMLSCPLVPLAIYLFLSYVFLKYDNQFGYNKSVPSHTTNIRLR